MEIIDEKIDVGKAFDWGRIWMYGKGFNQEPVVLGHFTGKEISIMNHSTPQQGFVWESGHTSVCVLLLPDKKGCRSICIGTEEIDGPGIIIKNDTYVYFCLNGTDNPHEYMVITDYDGPFKTAHSGDVFRFGKTAFHLL